MPRTTFETAFGYCALSWTDGGLTGFELPAARMQPGDITAPDDISRIIERVRQHLSGILQDFADLPFAFDLVPPFQAAVLRATLEVKPGCTSSYGQIAAAIGQPLAASRAVGTALGSNRWPLLIPCHRIVSASGNMVGFSGTGGIKTKLKLLVLEGAELFSE